MLAYLQIQFIDILLHCSVNSYIIYTTDMKLISYHHHRFPCMFTKKKKQYARKLHLQELPIHISIHI